MTLRPTLSQAQCSENGLVVLIPLGEKGGGPLAVEELKSKIELQTATLIVALLFFYAFYA